MRLALTVVAWAMTAWFAAVVALGVVMVLAHIDSLSDDASLVLCSLMLLVSMAGLYAVRNWRVAS